MPEIMTTRPPQPPTTKKYSKAFNRFVDDIDGEHVPGKRSLIRIRNRIIDLPNAWLRKVSKPRVPGPAE